MYHTVYMYKEIDWLAYSLLFQALKECSSKEGARFFKTDEHDSVFECHLFREQGLIIYLRHFPYEINGSEVHYHAIEIRMNPKRLIKKDEYIEVTRFNDYQTVADAFKGTFKKVKDIFLKLESSWPVPFTFDNITAYKIGRIDYCVNIKVPDAQKYMELIRRADKPKRFEIVQAYDPKSKRTKPFSDSYYLENKSVCINFYNKKSQLIQVLGEKADITKAEGIIRFEIQCKKTKVNNLVKKYGIENCLYELTKSGLSIYNLLYYYDKTIGCEDYYSLRKAREIIDQSGYKQKHKKQLVRVLKLIAQKRSVWKARDEYKNGKKAFNEALKKIKKLHINPVTIPDNWKIDFLPNLICGIKQEFMADNE